MNDPARFRLQRAVDVSGVSGEGHVADGVLWPDGTVSMRWRGEYATAVTHDRGLASVKHINLHGGATVLEWIDWPDLVDPSAAVAPGHRIVVTGPDGPVCACGQAWTLEHAKETAG